MLAFCQTGGGTGGGHVGVDDFGMTQSVDDVLSNQNLGTDGAVLAFSQTGGGTGGGHVDVDDLSVTQSGAYLHSLTIAAVPVGGAGGIYPAVAHFGTVINGDHISLVDAGEFLKFRVVGFQLKQLGLIDTGLLRLTGEGQQYGAFGNVGGPIIVTGPHHARFCPVGSSPANDSIGTVRNSGGVRNIAQAFGDDQLEGKAGKVGAGGIDGEVQGVADVSSGLGGGDSRAESAVGQLRLLTAAELADITLGEIVIQRCGLLGVAGATGFAGVAGQTGIVTGGLGDDRGSVGMGKHGDFLGIGVATVVTAVASLAGLCTGGFPEDLLDVVMLIGIDTDGVGGHGGFAFSFTVEEHAISQCDGLFGITGELGGAGEGQQQRFLGNVDGNIVEHGEQKLFVGPVQTAADAQLASQSLGEGT